MKNLFWISYISLLVSSSISAQTVVKGQITDGKKQPIPFANVLILKAKDSLFVKAGITDEQGSWTIRELVKGTYLVKIQMIGYVPYQSTPLSINDEKAIDLPNLVLKESTETLATMEVIYKKPFLEQRAGTLVVNVANSIVGSVGSLSDVLKKVPGLLIINNKVEIVGRSSVGILIDGRSTDYLDIESLLRDLPADQIERIEVISQPDARFDAAGSGGIINVVLKKNISLGTNGYLTLWTAQGDFFKKGISASLNKRHNGLNLYGGASLYHAPSQERMELVRGIGETTFNQKNYLPTNGQGMFFKGGFDYNLTKKQTIGVGISTSMSNNDRVEDGLTRILVSNQAENSFQNFNTIKRANRNISANVYYSFELDTNGRKLEWAANGVDYKRTSENQITTKKLSEFNTYFPNRLNYEPGITKIFATRIDYTHPLSKKTIFTTGLKLSRANLDNDLLANVQNTSDWTVDKGLSNHYIYREDILAAYINSTVKLGKIDWQSGLRYEYTLSKGYSKTIDTILTRQYGRLFPSTSFSMPITKIMGKQINIMAAYSYRINRPNYATLNPFVRYLDPYTFEKGNPQLKPELTHSANLSLTYEGNPFITFEYNKTNNAIQTVSQQDDIAKTTYGFDENIAQYTQIGGHLFLPLMFFKGMDGFIGVRIHQNRYESDYLGNKLNLKSTSFIAFMQSSYKINKCFTAEIGARYIKGGLMGLMTMGDLFTMEGGIKGKFWDNRLTVSASIDNPFVNYFDGRIRYLNQNIDINRKWESRIVNLTLKYSFGSKFLKDRKQIKNSAQEEISRTVPSKN
jgi:ferric enterobactin receptor